MGVLLIRKRVNVWVAYLLKHGDERMQPQISKKGD